MASVWNSSHILSIRTYRTAKVRKYFRRERILVDEPQYQKLKIESKVDNIVGIDRLDMVGFTKSMKFDSHHSNFVIESIRAKFGANSSFNVSLSKTNKFDWNQNLISWTLLESATEWRSLISPTISSKFKCFEFSSKLKKKTNSAWNTCFWLDKQFKCVTLLCIL